MVSSVQKEKIVIACRKAWERAGRGKMLLGVSGGADSTALMLAFSKANIPFEVAHCNFNLRQAESLRDREFVSMLCKNFGVPFHVVNFDVAKEALKGESTEMTCRRIRYDYFKRLKQEGNFDRVVVGHNADDNVETFFLHALRGSGTRGLKGMEEDTGGILRPLLPYRRKELLDFLKAHTQAFITDSSNMQTEAYRRNFLRNKVFPLIESKWEGFSKALANTIDLQKRENRIVEHFTAEALKGVTDLLPWHVIYNFPDAETLIYRFIEPFGGTPTMAHEMAESAASLMPGKEWNFGGTASAVFTKKGIKIENLAEIEGSGFQPSCSWELLEGEALDMQAVTCAPLSEAYLPFGEDRYEWRPANKEMRIKSLGLDGSQPVWKVLKDAGYTPAERQNFMVLVDKQSGEPIWLPAVKRSRLHLVDPDATSAYRLTCPS